MSNGANHPDPPATPSRHAVSGERHSVTLHPGDAAALDVCLEPGFSEAPVNEAERSGRVQAWLRILGLARAQQPPADLVARTLRAVANDQADADRKGAVAAERVRTRAFGLGRRSAEWLTVAVAATLVLAVLIPGLVMARRSAMRVMCAANLADMGRAFAAYATANHSELPTLGVSPDGNWLPHEGALVESAGHSNTANLLPLFRQGYVTEDKLVCPARALRSVAFDPARNEIPDNFRGYSYINLFGPAPLWDRDPTTVVLADRNPLFANRASATAPATPSAETKPADTNAPSANHARRGMNVLTAEQSVRWVTTPGVGPGGDNIWTIADRSSSSYTGREVVRVARDLFLAP